MAFNGKTNQTINLTLIPIDSRRNNIKCREHVNLDALKIINGARILKNDKNSNYNEPKIINKYYKETQLHDNGIVQYFKGNRDYKNKFGRVYSNGLQFLTREIKNTIIKEDPFNDSNVNFNYTDLDIKNCIPSILSSILQNNKNEIIIFLQKYKN